MADEGHSTPLISKQEAKAQGLKRYFTGKPCKHGHVAERLVSTATCILCNVIYQKTENAQKHKKSYFKEYRKRDAVKQIRKKYLKEYIKRYQKTAKHKKYQKEYKKYNRETNVNFRLAANLRTRLYHTVKGGIKSGSSICDLGCSVEFLKQHLEQQFQNGMTWENYGKVWEIDHIEPLCSFDLEDREQLLIVCHYTNLQPLFGPDNLKKLTEDKKKKFKPGIDPNYSCLIELDLLEDENPATKKD